LRSRKDQPVAFHPDFAILYFSVPPGNHGNIGLLMNNLLFFIDGRSGPDMCQYR